MLNINQCKIYDLYYLVRWAQELSRYHIRIDYCQEKANAVADALFRFPQRSQAEE